MIPEVLPLAKAMQRPVKLIWTREQDVNRADAADDRSPSRSRARRRRQGDRLAPRVVGESVVAYRGTDKALEGAKGIDGILLEGSKHEYGIRQSSIAYLREKRGIAVAAWRGSAPLQQVRRRILHR